MKLPSLNSQILIAALLGGVLGWLTGALPLDSAVRETVLFASGLIGDIFIGMLKMVLIPLVFTSIAVGIANLQAHSQMHRVWITTVGFFVFSMALSILLALIASNVFRPGEGLHLAMFQDAMQSFQAKHLGLAEFISQFFQSILINPFAALAQGNVLGVVAFAMLVGIALVSGGGRYQGILLLLQEFFELVMRIVGWIMRLAPIGVMALLIKLVASQDASLIGSLGKFIMVVIGTLLVHGVVVLPLILYLVTGKTPLWFWRGAREALITAFATSSSSATLPVTLRCAEQHLHVQRNIAGFVIPLGATINMDGTALYEAAAALFVANLAGIEMGVGQQIVVFMTAMIAAMGAPGIPSAGMVTMAMVLQSVGLPVEAIAILLPIDRLLDTLRTTINVQGDMVGSLVVQKLVKPG